MSAGLIVLLVIAALVLVVLFRTVRIVPQANAGIVERLGRYHRTLDAGIALVGAQAVVLERVDADGGRVKIGGEVWTARPFFDDQVIEPGKRVEVAKIQGATALVFE